MDYDVCDERFLHLFPLPYANCIGGIGRLLPIHCRLPNCSPTNYFIFYCWCRWTVFHFQNCDWFWSINLLYCHHIEKALQSGHFNSTLLPSIYQPAYNWNCPRFHCTHAGCCRQSEKSSRSDEEEAEWLHADAIGDWGQENLKNLQWSKFVNPASITPYKFIVNFLILFLNVTKFPHFYFYLSGHIYIIMHEKCFINIVNHHKIYTDSMGGWEIEEEEKCEK